MKKNVVLIIVLMFALNVHSQKITDFFLMLPDSSVMYLPKADRELIVKHSADNVTKDDMYLDFEQGKVNYGFSIMDIKNGYLELTGMMEGRMQFCYWNKADGTKLIAAYEEGCGPVCGVVSFDFYVYDGKKLTPVKRSDIIPDIYDDFFTGDPEKQKAEIEKEDVFATLLYELPRTGKNITAKFGNEESQAYYKKYAKGDRMELIWNDGTFKKGKFYWVENSEY